MLDSLICASSSRHSNRFCNSPANTSSGYCTLVDPSQVTLKSCNSSNIEKQPYYDDCRWKTQNVSVDHNVFDFVPASVSVFGVRALRSERRTMRCAAAGGRVDR